MRYRSLLLAFLFLLPALKDASANTGQFDADLEFKFVDTRGQLVPGACLFGWVR